MGTFLIYAIVVSATVFLAIAISRSEKAPSAAYAVLGLLLAFLLLFVLVDTKRIRDIPGFRAGQDVYEVVERVEELQKGSDRIQAGQFGRLLKLELRVAKLEAQKGLKTTNSTQIEPPESILWVDDKPWKNAVLVKVLRDNGVSVVQVGSTAEAEKELAARSFNAIISDMGRTEPDSAYKNKSAGLDLIRVARRQSPKARIYVYSSRTDAFDDAIDAGANRVTSSPEKLLSFLGFGPG